MSVPKSRTQIPKLGDWVHTSQKELCICDSFKDSVVVRLFWIILMGQYNRKSPHRREKRGSVKEMWLWKQGERERGKERGWGKRLICKCYAVGFEDGRRCWEPRNGGNAQELENTHKNGGVLQGMAARGSYLLTINLTEGYKWVLSSSSAFC